MRVKHTAVAAAVAGLMAFPAVAGAESVSALGIITGPTGDNLMSVTASDGPNASHTQRSHG